MKSLLTVLLLAVVPLYAFAQDAKMPADAKKVIDKYDATVEAAKKAYDAAVAKARDQAIKDLKPIQTAETKKGNLDGAMLIKGKVEELVSEAPSESKEVDLAKPSLPSSDIKAIVGKWQFVGETTHSTGVWEFKENGVASRVDGPGTYELKNGKIAVEWQFRDGRKFIDTIDIPKSGATTTEGVSSAGEVLKLTKKSR